MLKALTWDRWRRGKAAGVCNSTSVNGYCPGFGTAAWRISIPVGPLTGKLAQALRT